ncbi:hypothetical protein ACTXI4_08995 [Glutamicibacter ardleyensis]|uniref:hypothetical protein n=1 Tax=Glutamicibacter ardleyensis TaxID=225894 RepID=UPI003F94730D
MKRIPRIIAYRVTLYLGASIFGLGLLIGVYCLIAGRSPIAVIENLWIALVFALVTAVVTALCDHRDDAGQRFRKSSRK